MTTDPTWWLLARASGFTAYALLTASLLAGLVLKSRPLGPAIKPAAAAELHKSLALFGLVALAIHGVTLVLDRTVDITPLSLLVPGMIDYRPIWTGLGVVAAELIVVVIASFWLRRYIGARNWRRLHWASYLVFATATLHGLKAGSDTGRGWALGLYAGAVGAVAAASLWRALIPPPRPKRSKRSRGATAHA